MPGLLYRGKSNSIWHKLEKSNYKQQQQQQQNYFSSFYNIAHLLAFLSHHFVTQSHTLDERSV